MNVLSDETSGSMIPLFARGARTILGQHSSSKCRVSRSAFHILETKVSISLWHFNMGAMKYFNANSMVGKIARVSSSPDMVIWRRAGAGQRQPGIGDACVLWRGCSACGDCTRKSSALSTKIILHSPGTPLCHVIGVNYCCILPGHLGRKSSSRERVSVLQA